MSEERIITVLKVIISIAVGCIVGVWLTNTDIPIGTVPVVSGFILVLVMSHRLKSPRG